MDSRFELGTWCAMEVLRMLHHRDLGFTEVRIRWDFCTESRVRLDAADIGSAPKRMDLAVDHAQVLSLANDERLLNRYLSECVAIALVKDKLSGVHSGRELLAC